MLRYIYIYIYILLFINFYGINNVLCFLHCLQLCYIFFLSPSGTATTVEILGTFYY